jgi:hypothetical protein
MADFHGKLLEVDFNGMLLNFNGKEFWTTSPENSMSTIYYWFSELLQNWVLNR